MKDKKVGLFMELAGQSEANTFITGDEKTRELGAQLLLSEVLEYVIKGLGVVPSFNGHEISDPNGLKYLAANDPSKIEMLDGLSDVAYTMYWNALAFGMPLEEAFDVVCNNNLEKFVSLPHWTGEVGDIPEGDWDLGHDIVWPDEVVTVSVVQVAGGAFFAVGKDRTGKVRKPSSFDPVDLMSLL